MKFSRPEPPPLPADHTRAYCHASGLIEFGRYLPGGTTIIARGPETALQQFIRAHAQPGYPLDKAPPCSIPIDAFGPHKLLVPGMPEAPNKGAGLRALEQWLDRLKEEAPAGVLVI